MWTEHARIKIIIFFLFFFKIFEFDVVLICSSDLSFLPPLPLSLKGEIIFLNKIKNIKNNKH